MTTDAVTTEINDEWVTLTPLGPCRVMVVSFYDGVKYNTVPATISLFTGNGRYYYKHWTGSFMEVFDAGDCFEEHLDVTDQLNALGKLDKEFKKSGNAYAYAHSPPKMTLTIDLKSKKPANYVDQLNKNWQKKNAWGLKKK